ncbi:MAG: alpha/beta hydrolase fold protein, partial [Pseudonocardia sp.]|nr:alpha/beta hydrolase fold protein [Pseudonocardia sp.]
MTVGRSAPVGGVALAYDRAGSGTPVLVLHGWPGDRDDFAAVTELLMGRAADVVRPDLRGFGASDKHTGGDYSAAGQV